VVVISVGRLIRKSNDQKKLNDIGTADPYLGQYIEIVNNESKYYGYKGWVSKNYASDNRYKLYIEPKQDEEPTDESGYHVNFIKRYDARKWLNLIGY
jgi:hypothetical protein